MRLLKSIVTYLLAVSIAASLISTGRLRKSWEFAAAEECEDLSCNEPEEIPANSATAKKWADIVVGQPTFFEQVEKRLAREQPVVEDPLITSKAPKWTNACVNKEDKLNESTINIHVTAHHNHPRHIIELDQKDRGMFVRMLEAKALGLPHWPPPPGDEFEMGKSRRRKRSIQATRSSRQGKLFVPGATASNKLRTVGNLVLSSGSKDNSDKSILYKKPAGSANKKTSFALGRRKHLVKPFGMQAAHKPSGYVAFQYEQAEQSNGLKSHAEPTQAPASTTPPVAGQIQKLSPTMERLIESFLANDIRLTWRLISALNMVSGLRKSMTKLSNLIGEGLTTDDSRLVADITEQRIKWLPPTDTLIRDNKQGAFHGSELVLRNMSHYVQYFEVAFEQMVYEQVNVDKRFASTYKKLEKVGLELACDLELLTRHVIDLKRDKDELWGQLNAEGLTLTDVNKPGMPVRIHPGSIRLADKQAQYSGNAFESPWLNALIGAHKTRQAGTGEFVERSVMPEIQRKLGSSAERSIRDRSIFDEFNQFLTFYETVLNNMY